MENIVSVTAWGQTLGLACKNSTGSVQLSWGYKRRKESLSPSLPSKIQGGQDSEEFCLPQPFSKHSWKQTIWIAAEVVFVVKKLLGLRKHCFIFNFQKYLPGRKRWRVEAQRSCRPPKILLMCLENDTASYVMFSKGSYLLWNSPVRTFLEQFEVKILRRPQSQALFSHEGGLLKATVFTSYLGKK